MMDFNDACRYQNHLYELLRDAQQCLSDDHFVTTTTKTHHKHDANKNASDEVEISTDIHAELGITPNKIIQFAVDVINEREELAKAIGYAKASADLQIDAACMANKDKRNLANYLNILASKRSSEIEATNTGYAMNEIDGKQTPYVYRVTVTKTINFDRNEVKGIVNRFNRETRETSKDIERYNLETQVDFDPRWSEDDSIEDILSTN